MKEEVTPSASARRSENLAATATVEGNSGHAARARKPELERSASHILDAYVKMENARKFALAAWQQPEISGRFYAVVCLV